MNQDPDKADIGDGSRLPPVDGQYLGFSLLERAYLPRCQRHRPGREYNALCSIEDLTHDRSSSSSMT